MSKVKITDVDFFANDIYKGIDISWEGNIGFGHLTISQNNNGKIFIDDENMGKDFCKNLFSQLIDSAMV